MIASPSAVILPLDDAPPDPALCLLPRALCVAFATMARSMKEGQYYMTPLYLVSLPLILVSHALRPAAGLRRSRDLAGAGAVVQRAWQRLPRGRLNAGSHVGPTFGGDTIYAWSEILENARYRAVADWVRCACEPLPPRTTLAGLAGQGRDGKYHPSVVLDLDYWLLMPRRAF